ncbi:TspO/MBR family protein [Flavobacteriaceae bacterium S356]|uniref:TspO/MBR family protein n=1 Tax=Asprobacillus argus TaxID=3076534 RepID=A0ABU3LIG5_9FLAO|nr:TspO/MBR family protein [Flavobacteriaceae bacterium S356]
MKKFTLLLLFLLINFGGLALGSWLMNNGPETSWYQDLSKAPWTPPGWVFGAAWTTIMLCFSIYLSELFKNHYSLTALRFFIAQVILNVGWNYVFFNQYEIAGGLIVIILLTSLIFYFFFTFKKDVKNYSYLLLPYMIWLCIATSLNLYILIHN